MGKQSTTGPGKPSSGSGGSSSSSGGGRPANNVTVTPTHVEKSSNTSAPQPKSNTK